MYQAHRAHWAAKAGRRGAGRGAWCTKHTGHIGQLEAGGRRGAGRGAWCTKHTRHIGQFAIYGPLPTHPIAHKAVGYRDDMQIKPEPLVCQAHRAHRQTVELHIDEQAQTSRQCIVSSSIEFVHYRSRLVL